MKNELLKLLPEFDLIKDPNLREKTLSVWMEAMSLGGWELPDLEKMPFTLLIPNCPVNIIQHVRAVAQVALKSAEILASSYRDYYTINMDYLISGVLLHDVGKFLEFQKDRKKISKSRAGKLLRHPISGAGLAMKHGLPDEVVHIIAVHSQEGEGGYRSPEAVIVHHADFMNFESLK